MPGATVPTVIDVRPAVPRESDLVTRIAALGFYDDPVMTWALPDGSRRIEQLTFMFSGVVDDMLSGGGTVHLAGDACAALWRDPSFDHEQAAHDRPSEAGSERPQRPLPFSADEIERLVAMDEAMRAAHPHEPHWYLNVVSTIPEQQGRGLGTAVLQPVLSICDAEGIRAYLESTNPRNRSLYRRHGFVEHGEIELPDGPSLTPMWREARG
jgi:ribosomal protein S18 acetylase RimI-like enzyme